MRVSWGLFFLLLFFLWIGVGVSYYLWERTKVPQSSSSLQTQSAVEKPNAEMREVTLFFATPTGKGLTGEQYQIPRMSLLEEVKAVLQALAAGSHHGNLTVVPPHATVREVYLDKEEGTAYIDFTPELRTEQPGGSWWELLTIYSIVNSLTQNFPEIKRVQILIQGEEIKTLAGHVRADSPFAERLAFE